jgi:hypothetical protein
MVIPLDPLRALVTHLLEKEVPETLVLVLLNLADVHVIELDCAVIEGLVSELVRIRADGTI